MKCIGKLLRIKPIAKRDISNKCGVCFVFEIQNIGEITRTFNLPTGTISNSTILIKLLKNTKCWPVGGAILSSPYLASVYIEEKLRNQSFELMLEPTGNRNYPWNVVSITAEY